MGRAADRPRGTTEGDRPRTPAYPWLAEFLLYARAERGLSANTIDAYRRDLDAYLTWLARQGVQPDAASRDDVVAYVGVLKDSGLAATSIERKLAAVRHLHRFAVREGLASSDPTADVATPKRPKRLPDVMSISEAACLVGTPPHDARLGPRDRAILELMYGSGLRVGEMVGLDLEDLDLEQGLVRVRGKGGKERLVPLGSASVAALAAYIEKIRPVLVRKALASGRGAREAAALVLSGRGTRLTRQSVWRLIRRWARAAGVDAHPHTLRHSYATHLVQGGADLRAVQELLGHADISTTQVYTEISKEHVKEEYYSLHPRAQAHRRKGKPGGTR